MDNDIFLVIAKMQFCYGYPNNVSVFWCLSLIFGSRNNNDNDVEAKTDQTMTTHLGQSNFEPLVKPHAWTTFRESGKSGSIHVAL